jgi:hypothetical protein
MKCGLSIRLFVQYLDHIAAACDHGIPFDKDQLDLLIAIIGDTGYSRYTAFPECSVDTQDFASNV